MSGNCDELVDASCSLVQQGSELVVSTKGTVERKSGSCNDDCTIPMVSCQSAAIAPGHYTLRYGEGTTEVDLPVTKSLLFGNASDQFFGCP